MSGISRSNGIALPPGAGHRIVGGGIDATVKTSLDDGSMLCTFEMNVPPGYDVGAHVHNAGQEFFFVLSGELSIMAFEPVDRGISDWHEWVSPSGERVLTGGPGSFLWVPVGVPHAFSNTTDETAKMFFQSGAPGGHDNYFVELAKILERDGAPDPATIDELCRRYDVDRITDLADGR